MLQSFRGQLPPSEWYPAHEKDVTARHVVIPSGEAVRVVESGPPGGEPVALVHGWGCSAYFFRRLIPSLAGAGYRVHAIDLRGHGGSARPADPSLYTGPAMQQFLADALDAAGVGRAHLIAHSLGGGVTLDIAATMPGRVRSLSLLAPVGLARLRFITLARIATPPLAAPLVPYAVPRWSIPLMLRAMYGTEGRWASRDVDEYWAPTADPAYAIALRELLHRYEFGPRTDEQLGRIAVPVLVLLGDRDLLVRSRAAARRAGARSGWQTVMIEGAGHVLAEEVPDRVLAALQPHLSSAPA